MMNKVVFGIDVGGTTIKCGFFSDDGELIEEELPTRKENSGENILPDIAEYIKMTLAMHKKKFTDIAGIGIGVPGAVRDDGTVNKCVNLGWDVVNVPDKLSELLIFPKEKIKAGTPYVLRLRSPGAADRRISFSDGVKGNIEMPEKCGILEIILIFQKIKLMFGVVFLKIVVLCRKLLSMKGKLVEYLIVINGTDFMKNKWI